MLASKLASQAADAAAAVLEQSNVKLTKMQCFSVASAADVVAGVVSLD